MPVPKAMLISPIDKELADLMKRLLPPQQVGMGDVPPWLAVVSSSKFKYISKK